MYAVRLPKDLKDKEKAFKHQQDADAYTVADPANLVGALWGTFNKTSAGQNRHQSSLDGSILLSAIRRSDEDARNRPFIPGPQYFKNTAVVNDIIGRHLLVAYSNQCIQLRRDTLLHSLKHRISVKRQEEAHQREQNRLERETAKKIVAAVKIQSIYKGHVAREQRQLFSHHPCTNNEDVASATPSSRRQHHNHQKIELENQQDWAATKIQSMYRMWRSRYIVASLRSDHADKHMRRIQSIAATYIQRWWRRWRRKG